MDESSPLKVNEVKREANSNKNYNNQNNSVPSKLAALSNSNAINNNVNTSTVDDTTVKELNLQDVSNPNPNPTNQNQKQHQSNQSLSAPGQGSPTLGTTASVDSIGLRSLGSPANSNTNDFDNYNYNINTNEMASRQVSESLSHHWWHHFGIMERSTTYSVGKHIDPDHYVIFRHPAHIDHDAAAVERIAKEGARIKVRTRMTREFNVFMLPFVTVLLEEIFKNDDYPATDLAFTFGIGVVLMTTVFFGHFFVILSGVCDFRRHGTKKKYLHRIYSLNYEDPEWAGMTFTFAALQFKYHPIMSISELSAVMGGTAHTLLLVTSSYTFGILATTIICLNYYDEDFQWTADVILVIIGCFGLTMVGSFELDQLSMPMIAGHYIGAGLCLCAWVAFTIQSILLGIATDWYYWEGVCICGIMLCLIIGGFSSWEYWQREAMRFVHNKGGRRDGLTDKELKRAVTILTYKNIISEAAFLSVPAYSVAGWLLQYGYCQVEQCHDW